LNGETTTWRTKLRKAIIKADYPIVSGRPVDGVFGMDRGYLSQGEEHERHDKGSSPSDPPAARKCGHNTRDKQRREGTQ
jgi:hypothetical protein